jgi:molybdopterin-guanine dinucleotide biosynthesis protein A
MPPPFNAASAKLIDMPPVEICILAGGLSARMGKNKARLRLGGKTLLTRVKEIARQTGCPVRIVRRDLVKRCGPLGGVLTALSTTRAERVLFLACDMPFVTRELLEKIIDSTSPRAKAVFAQHGRKGKAGFPFILHRSLREVVQCQLNDKDCALQSLARRCRAKRVFPRIPKKNLFNVNTPEDWQIAKSWL